MKITSLLASIILGLTLAGCSGSSDITNAAEVQEELDDLLQVGASKEYIEATLVRLNIGHSFDKYASRYQGIIRNAGGPMDHAVVVYVYMDENDKLTRVETHDSYTGP